MFGHRQQNPLPGLTRPKIPRDGSLVASLDVGAAKTVCFIARMTPVDIGPLDCEIIGAGHFGAPLDGSPADEGMSRPDYRMPPSFAARERAIRHSVDAAEAMASERIEAVHVSVPAQSISCVRVAVDLDVSGGFVTAEDITDSLAEGVSLTTPDQCTSLHVSPIGYAIDGEMVGTDPRGMRGRRLTTFMLGINASENTLSTLRAVVEAAGLEVLGFIAGPLAGSEAILIDDEKDLGVLALDLGAHAVGYSLFSEGRMAGCGGCLPGAGFITRDISSAFSTPLAYAERQKILHGTVFGGAGDEHRFVDMAGFTPTDPRTRISKADMTDVIVPRMEEIYEAVTRKLVTDQLDLDRLRRIVLTGGGSQLHGLCEHVERAFSMKARLGRPDALHGLPEALTGPAFAVGVGVLRYLACLWGTDALYPEIDRLPSDLRARSARAAGAGWRRLRF
ncbi:MAG: cell division protein FtsA [Pseudomonadota bacterium]